MIGKLGRRPPKNAPALRLASFLTGAIPAHPVKTDHLGQITDWQMLGNDQFGDCGPVSAANLRAMVTAALTGRENYPTLQDVFDLYRRSGNPNFDPATDADDNGVDMQTMCEALVSGGIAGVKALAFAKVDVSSLDEIRGAVAIFGGLLLGVNLETAQQDQTDQGLWDYQNSGEWGGHAVLAGGYTSATAGADVSVVTWAQLVGLTDRFWTHQVEEAWVVIWPEHLGTVQFQQGVDLAQLAADYKALTGRVLPVPTPTPPTPGDPDAALAAVAHHWVAEHHIGENHKMQTALKTWLQVKGL